MQNVAAYAGVSIATVSRVVQGDPTVRPDNVVAVQNAIEALGYRLNPVAAELRRGRRKLIGVVVDDLDPVTTALVRSIERHAEERGFAIWVECSDGSAERESMLISRLQDWRVAGFILQRVHGRSQGPDLLLEDAAVVVLDGPEAGAGFDNVFANPDAAARDLAGRLKESGHREVLVLASCDASRRSERLCAGLMAALEQTGFIGVRCLRLGDEPWIAAGQLDADLSRADRPTVVIALDPGAGHRVASYASGRRWVRPDDLLMVGVLAAELAGQRRVHRQAIVHPTEDVAAEAISLVLQRVDLPRRPPAAAERHYALRWS